MVIYLVTNNIKSNFMFLKQKDNIFYFLVFIFFSLFLLFFDFYFSLSNKIHFYTDRIVFIYYYLFNKIKFFINSRIFFLRYLKDIYKENFFLKKQNLFLNKKLLYLNFLQLENNIFRKILNFPLFKKNSNDFIFVNFFFYYLNNIDEIVINHIYDYRIKYGSLLFNKIGMLGKVIYSGNYFSRIQLICNKNSILPVNVLRNNINSVILGCGCKDYMKINDFPINSDIKLGDIIILPNISDYSFSGYPIGVVNNVYLDLVDGFLVVNVKYFLELDNLDFGFLYI